MRMLTLEQQMAVYQRYHRDSRNKATHCIGVPLIVFAIFIPMSWPQIVFGQVTVTLSEVFAFAVLSYYFALDRVLAAAMLPIIVALLIGADTLAARGYAIGLTWFGASFVAGWILQLVGHAFEGRKPALVDNFFQIFIAPIFLLAELFFALGWRKDVRHRLEELVDGPVPQRPA
jgi:uncharacterized membrane protein YGL010W